MAGAQQPASLTASRAGDEAVTRQDGSITLRLTWLMLFRAVMVAALLLSTVAVRLGTGADIFGPGSIVVYGASAATYGAILAGALWLNTAKERAAVWVAHTQLLWDAGLATALSLATGGIESGFAFLYFINVLIAAAVLGRRGALIVAAESTLFFFALLGAQLAGALDSFGTPGDARLADVAAPVMSTVMGMFLIAILAGYLSEQLRRTSESLSEAREHLASIEELYAAVLRSLPSGVLTVDDDGHVVYVNDAGLAILGREPDEMVGERVGEVAGALPVDAPAPARALQRFEVEYKRDEESRVLGGSVARLTGVEPLAGRVIVFQDLTELRQLQRDISRADRLATLGRFSAGLAHEIRNPLAAMIGCLELLQADLNSPPQERATESGRMLQIVHREAERLSNLVSAFLTYARPRPPQLEATPLGKLITETLDAVGQSEREVEFSHELTDDDNARCDPEQIKQVIWNLVGNAVQATAPGHDADEGGSNGAQPPRRRVSVELRSERDTVVISVEDNGPGVGEEAHGKLFEPFFTTRPTGTGLGLATCYQIVDAHGGELRVDRGSALGGARFEVRLPRDGERKRSVPPSDPGFSVAELTTPAA
jgi:two-component system sensor histidine kinase PilS (NtrC family)